MKWIKYLLLVLTALMLAIPAWAQRSPGRFYDPKNVVTVQGQVEKVDRLSRPGRRGGAGKPGQQTQVVHLKTDQGVLLVHLGPARFLEEQQFAPKVGDTMSVTGSKLTTGKGDVILAAQVKSGDKNRYPAGRPGSSGLARPGQGRPPAFSQSQGPDSGPGSTSIIWSEDFSFSGQKYLPKPGLHVTPKVNNTGG
jgi:hypothetical protein